MTTLHNLGLSLVDLQDRLQRELQFSSDSRNHVMNAMGTVREALDALDQAIQTAFDERMRALSAALGNGKPSPETITSSEPAKPVKRLREVGADA